MASGAFAAVESNHWAEGGKGAVDLGRAVMAACKAARAEGLPFKFLYPSESSIVEKTEAVCKLMYQAAAVTWSDIATAKIQAYTASGFSSLPICIAKTQCESHPFGLFLLS